ncbi:hypothetical protein TRAPUB_13617 [Trametes pubescens]|uniref:F-box domain-containing protein n=1 Tax=Trametes pubescens TaxID=154538 RepID=A0A1M2VQI7_TRAPU|nr:hypothetical protein TRAPUB_13617 [Trametes pubescens]
MESLPTELIDDILEHVYYDKGRPQWKTLRACASISRAWREPAQRLLFRRVVLGSGIHGRPAHISFREATDPETEHGRILGQHVRVLEVYVGEKSGADLDDADLVDILARTPRLHELALHVAAVYKISLQAMDELTRLATSGYTSTLNPSITPIPLRVRSLAMLSCGVQSPILYQLLQLWPCVEFLYLGVEIAAPPPKWTPTFRLYQLTLMRMPRVAILSWLLSASKESLRIASFRDAPGHEVDPLLEEFGPRLRSLRLMNYNLRATAILKLCPNLEELVIVQLSTLFKLDNLPRGLEHLSCRNLPAEDQSLGLVIQAVGELSRLRVVTCDGGAVQDERFGELEELCGSKKVELCVDQVPFWVVREFNVPATED